MPVSKHSRFNENPGENLRSSIVSRVLLFLIPALCLAQCSFSQEVTEQQPAAEIDFKGGYSIFTETMADMTWPEIERAAENNAIVLLPLGVIEEHGPHIDCGADIYLAYAYCRFVKQELERNGVQAIIAPPFYWGVNYSTRNFPGSFDMKPETMKALLTEILANLKHWGFKRVCYVNCHGEGGHNQVIMESARESRENPGIEAFYLVDDIHLHRYGLKGDEEYIAVIAYEPPGGEPVIKVPDFHAGAFETGDMIALFPGLVDAELAKMLKAPEVKEGDYQQWGHDARKVTPLGYGGDPSACDPAWSKRNILLYAAAMAEAIRKAAK
jgi:creatinine amidohydrolase